MPSRDFDLGIERSDRADKARESWRALTDNRPADELPPDGPVGDETAEPDFGTAYGGLAPEPELAAPDSRPERGEELAAMLGVVHPADGVLTLAEPSDMVTLDPSIAFERAIAQMVLTARRKRSDYALAADEFSNFRGPADLLGVPAWLYAIGEVAWKLERIKSLRANGRLDDPENEAVADTVLDAAVFGVLALAMHREDEAAAAG